MCKQLNGLVLKSLKPKLSIWVEIGKKNRSGLARAKILYFVSSSAGSEIFMFTLGWAEIAAT